MLTVQLVIFTDNWLHLCSFDHFFNTQTTVFVIVILCKSLNSAGQRISWRSSLWWRPDSHGYCQAWNNGHHLERSSSLMMSPEVDVLKPYLHKSVTLNGFSTLGEIPWQQEQQQKNYKTMSSRFIINRENLLLVSLWCYFHTDLLKVCNK